jgi:hypothetical protein
MCHEDPAKRGPAVADAEELYRPLRPEWVREDGSISAGAFNGDCFSLEIASRAAGPADTLSRVPQCCAVAAFQTGCARASGLDTRDERDDAHPENFAHAHVYQDGPPQERKKRAKAFMEACRPSLVLNNCPPRAR